MHKLVPGASNQDENFNLFSDSFESLELNDSHTLNCRKSQNELKGELLNSLIH